MANTTTSQPFGAQLLRWREAAGLSQEELATRAGLSPKTIAGLERGRRHAPRSATVERLATALGLAAMERAQLVLAAEQGSASPGGPPQAVAAQAASTATASDPAASGPRRRLRWLAAEPTPLVDRIDELHTMVRLLAVEGARLLTLTGPAGVGKTRLALAAAARLADVPRLFPDGVVFVDLSPVRDPGMVFCAIELALGLLDIGGRPALEHLKDALEERHLLLVLDNFEQLLPGAASLADLLAACLGLALLVTSRVPLQLRAEQTLRVAPLPVPDLTRPLPPLAKLAAIPSVELFLLRARAHQANFVLSEKDAPVVARLAVHLDGLPLALELAAARTAALSLPMIEQWLGDRLRLLRWEAADLPERQRSLEAAVGWSYDLLSEEERHLFRCLGVFVGRVAINPLIAIARVLAGGSAEEGDGDSGRTLDLLTSLAKQSLILLVRSADLSWQQGGQGGSEDAVEPDAKQAAEQYAPDDEVEAVKTGEPAFGMLETVREYAEERLAAAGELETARRAHAHYLLALAERADSELRGRDQRAWFFRIEREHDNLRAALRWQLDQADPAERAVALRLAGALGYFWWIRGYHAEGIRWLDEALARAPGGEGIDPAASEPARTRALYWSGALLTLHGELERARARLDEALALARQRHDPAGIAWTLIFQGQRAVYGGEAEQALAVPLLQEALRAAREPGEPQVVCMALFFLGVAAHAQGHPTAAAAHYAEALELCEAMGDGRCGGAIHVELGAIAGQRGDLPQARGHLQAALRASMRLRDRWLLGLGARAALAVVGDQADPIGRARLLGAVETLLLATGGGRAPWAYWADRSEPGLWTPRPDGEGEVAYRGGRSLSPMEVADLALRLLDAVAMLPSPAGADAEASPQPAAPGPQRPENLFTEREQAVLRLVADGLPSKAIARQLFISPSTVNYYLTSIFHKLGVNSRAQAVSVATQHGLM